MTQLSSFSCLYFEEVLLIERWLNFILSNLEGNAECCPLFAPRKFDVIVLRSNFQATPPPILIDNGIAVLENEVIERHIMKNIPGGHNLFVQDPGVSKLIENVYSKVRQSLCPFAASQSFSYLSA